jgi:hypothetical protein
MSTLYMQRQQAVVSSVSTLSLGRCIAKNEKIEFVIVENENSNTGLDEMDAESLQAFQYSFEKGNEVYH